MPVPQINAADMSAILSEVQNIEYLTQGGQKIVFTCEIEGKPCVIKCIQVGTGNQVTDQASGELTMPPLDGVTARAQREVDTMASINVPTLVKLGPIGLRTTQIRGQSILYFTEERIEGRDLHDILNDQGVLPIRDVVSLGLDVAVAVEAIWSLKRIHRDIKPSNIMRKNTDGRFVLLDVGFVFDLEDISLTASHVIVGTKTYMSPDQILYMRKRQLDFRSDLFLLGIVLYEAATRQHPFTLNTTSTDEVFARILNANPSRPTQIRSEIPYELEQIIMQLLQKLPHLRYRSCQQLIDQLEQI